MFLFLTAAFFVRIELFYERTHLQTLVRILLELVAIKEILKIIGCSGVVDMQTKCPHVSKGIADVGLLILCILSKCVNHLPLCLQEHLLKRRYDLKISIKSSATEFSERLF